MPEQVEPSTTQQRKKNNLNEPKLALDVFFFVFHKRKDSLSCNFSVHIAYELPSHRNVVVYLIQFSHFQSMTFAIKLDIFHSSIRGFPFEL